MTTDQLKASFPNASDSFLRANTDEAGQADFHPDCAGPDAVLERHFENGGMAALPLQEVAGKKFLVRLVAVRKRLLDWDNLCEKYHVDLLRYSSGGVFGDSPATTKIEIDQEKAGPGEREEVRIEVFEL